MKLLSLPKRRSAISEFIYIALNVCLGIGLLVAILAVRSPLPAIVLVLLSKWRVLAVRPNFWYKNIRSNLVDIIVSLSVVVLLYAATGAVGLQVCITIAYIGWLLFVKPRSKRTYIAVQAGVATFLGTTALLTVSYGWPAAIVVVLFWLIGYSSARHILRHAHDPNRNFLAMVWGLVVAELGWLGYHWSFAYSIPGFADVKLPQIALVITVCSFLAERIYASYHANEGAVKSGDIALPAFFSASIILVVLLFFNGLDSGLI